MSSAPDEELIFKLLGPIEVIGAEEQVQVPPGRQQTILGALLLEANRVVSMDQLIDLVWEHTPPSTARAQIQICVSALRREFARVGVDAQIETRQPGYLLRVAADKIDTFLFERRVADSDAAVRQGRMEEASTVLRAALALWRGPALGGAGATLQNKALRLDEKRLSVLENCVDIELLLGRHHALIGELQSMVTEHPLRERPRGQLMLALYRSGRQSEALDVYRAGRDLFIEHLGLEPSDQLRKLETAILTDDEVLRLDQEKSVPVTVQNVVSPHQLPATISDFIGRQDVVARAETVLSGDHMTMPVVNISGKAGIGKSALAVHVAHRVAAETYPDGQLYCDLRGTQAQPATPAEVLGRFLSALGAVGSTLPDGVDERADMYRSMLANRRVLVVLDDAGSESQVHQLLPGSPTCGVVVTSRTRLTGLAGSHLVDVDFMDSDDALELLGRIIGTQRLQSEPVAAAALVDVVGGLPLALRIIGARLAARTHWSLASMVGRLADERHRLDELVHGDMVVRASLSLTYDGLEPDTCRVMRLMSLLEAESLPVWTASALTDDDRHRGFDLLERLVDAQLLDVVGSDITGLPRYRFHDLIRLFAKEQLAVHEAPATQLASVERVAGGWLAMAEQAHQRLYGGDFTVLHGNGRRWQPSAPYLDQVLQDPLGWLESERPNICAAVLQAADAGLDELCWDLAMTLVTLFETRSYLDDWQQTHERALDAVRKAGNKRGTAALLCSLGSLHHSQRRMDASRAALEPALELFTELDDSHGLALVRRNLGLLEYNEGRPEIALRIFEQSLAGFKRVGDVVGQAYVVSQLAQLSLDRGEHELAVGQLRGALGMCREISSPRVEAQVLYRLGSAMLVQGRYEQAQQLITSVLGMVQRSGDTVGESYALHSLGLIHGRMRMFAEAGRLLRRAIRLCEENLDRVGAARIRLDLAQLVSQRGETFHAIAIVEQAMMTFQELRLALWESKALAVLEKITVENPLPAAVTSNGGAR
ncbi:DNA-binding transcriptional activator of the SARP family [Lentzea waywayandensis]|uniref:DNA-binding transcriptional activator of the SARP family n=1 Tax=Lentzea waywayandensis TaxID=84724 RepID=A0A1I6EU71_9PSEU|nr:BTAD domain-containing putative transcriptional regulator [Lentzea waywayandensis]SFR21294.1 DNA-binding transcriptional activator of the SARP family [Lentzea waywayandensis]